MARAYGRSVETEQRLWARRMLARGTTSRGEVQTQTAKRSRVVGSVLVDVLCFVLAFACGTVAMHASVTGQVEGCASCVVMQR